MLGVARQHFGHLVRSRAVDLQPQMLHMGVHGRSARLRLPDLHRIGLVEEQVDDGDRRVVRLDVDGDVQRVAVKLGNLAEIGHGAVDERAVHRQCRADEQHPAPGALVVGGRQARFVVQTRQVVEGDVGGRAQRERLQGQRSRQRGCIATQARHESQAVGQARAQRQQLAAVGTDIGQPPQAAPHL